MEAGVGVKKLAIPSRREILGAGLAALAASQLPTFGARFTDRVLVCIYLFGGNDDNNNLIVPLEQYSSYRSARGGSALPKDSLLPVIAGKSQAMYGFHPALTELRYLFESRALAVVGSVGGSIATEQDKALGYLPDGFTVPGWALALSGGKGVFTQFAPGSDNNTEGGASLIALGGPTGDQLAKVVQSSLRSDRSLQTQFPETGLGSQLRQIAKVIGFSGLKQQIYLCPISGFTTGADQLSRQEALFRELSSAMAAFYQATVELGVDRRVTTFTDAEFNPALLSNTKNGTGQAWGGHQLALGGSVVGGDVYGPDNAEVAGAFTQRISKQQYSAAFAKWVGVDGSDLNRLFPGLDGMTPATLEFLS
jgi:uncharacterized protein (DUF1501 family)